MAEPYRFGGPIPERAKQLAARRTYRGFQSFAVLKKNRRLEFLESPGPYWEQVRDGMGAVIDVRPKAAAITGAAKTEADWCRAALAPFKYHDAPAAPGLLPLCAWRIEGQDFSRPGFTTDFEQVKFWSARGATVTPLHQPSEEGLFRTVSGAVLERLASPQPLDAWGGPLPESASTARDHTSDTRAAIDRVAQQMKAVRDTHPEAAPESQSSPLASSNPPDRETSAAPLPGLQRPEPPAQDSAR